MIYLDTAATTKIEDEVLEEMMPYLTDEYGNAGTSYSIGRRAKRAIETARGRVATLFGTKDTNRVIFTSGGSEGNNFVLKGFTERASMLRWMITKSSNHVRVIISAAEHDSVLNAVKTFDSLKIKVYTIVPKPMSGITVEDIKQWESENNTTIASDDCLTLLYIMKMNNETGVENDIHGIGEYCRSVNNHGTLWFGSDCVQAAGQRPLNVDEDNLDFAVVSSHKIGGPKGVGAVYVRNLSMVEPMIHGGEEQEYGLRGGTENVAGIVGFGKACELAVEKMEERQQSLVLLRKEFVTHLMQEIMGKYIEVRVNEQTENNYTGQGNKVLSLTVFGVSADSLVLTMDEKGVCIAAGSACRTTDMEASRALLAYGFSETDANMTVRISFPWVMSYDDVDNAVEKLVECIDMLQSYSEEC